METFSLSRKEIPRVGLLKAAVQGKVTNEEAAKALCISVRQFQRLKVRFAEGGLEALQHRSRGRRSPRRMHERLRRRIVRLIESTYAGLNDCHLTEKLREVEQISIGRESVRKLRRLIGLCAKRKRRPPRHRIRRLREAREGALVQTDGSPHDWLQGRGPSMCLVGTVDDATGKILGATFRLQEDLHGYATAFHQMFTKYGLPLAIYGDGTNVLVRNDRYWTLEEELLGAQFPTQLGRVLKDLGIRYIRAYSPQAKGRVENRWSVLQDRLVSELRLRKITSLEKANNYLPGFIEDFNRRFGKPPRDTMSVWRRPPKDLDLILSCRYFRTVSRDNVVTLSPHENGRGSQRSGGDELRSPARTEIHIPPGPRRRSYSGLRVEVRETLNGRIIVLHKGTLIASIPRPAQGFTLVPRSDHQRKGAPSAHSVLDSSMRSRKQTAKPTTRGTKWAPPPPDHPWKRNFPLTRTEG